MKKILLITALIMALAIVPGFGTESDMEDMRGTGTAELPPGKWWRIPDVSNQLGLTPEEQAHLDDLFIQSRRALIDLKSSVQKEKLELEVLFDKTEFNEAAVMERFKKFQDARDKIGAERFKFLVEVRKILGKERFDLLKSKFQEKRKKMIKERHENRKKTRDMPQQ